jgi:uncharacterized membrane protein
VAWYTDRSVTTGSVASTRSATTRPGPSTGINWSVRDDHRRQHSRSREQGSEHALVTVLIVFVIGYGALYEADDDRNPDREADVVGVPVRFISLVGVGAIFSVAGAATADSLF